VLEGKSARSTQELVMSAEDKQGFGSAILLVLLGILTMLAGAHWLVILVPAAGLVRYGVFTNRGR
jgi:hypothetical protein